MKCDVSPTIAFVDFDTALSEQFGWGDDVLGFRIPTQRDYRSMFKQQNNVASAAFFAERDELFLQAKPSRIINVAELEDGDQNLGHGLHGSTRI